MPAQVAVFETDMHIDEIPAAKPLHPFRAAILAVSAEKGCSKSAAERMLRWLRDRTNEARKRPDGTLRITGRDMTTREYKLFDEVMPHGVTPAEGSAHEAVVKALIHPESGEYGLIHDQRGGNCELHIGRQTTIRVLHS